MYVRVSLCLEGLLAVVFSPWFTETRNGEKEVLKETIDSDDETMAPLLYPKK